MIFVLAAEAIFCIIVGVKKLHVAKMQGQPLAWYTQTNIHLGLIFFLGSLWILLLAINNITNNKLSDTIAYIAMVVLGVPDIIVFVLLFKYRTLPQNKTKTK